MAENPHPIYSGEQYRVAPSAKSIVPSSVSPAIQEAAEGMQKVHETLSEFESEGIDRAEYTLDLQRQKYTAETEADINRDIDNKFTLPDGHKDSFYDISGKFREDFYADYVAKVKSRFDNLHLGYIRPDSQLKASEASEKIKTQLVKSLDAKLAINLAPRAKAAATKLLDFQLEMGDFVGARATLMGAPDYAMSDLDKQVALSRIERASIMKSVENAAISGDREAYLALVTDDATMSKLSYDERKRALAMQKSLSFPSSGAIEESTTGSTRSAGTTGSASPAHMGLPQGVPDALVKLYDRWNLHADKDAMKSEEMQREARQALDSFASALAVPDMAAEDIMHFQSVASCFGISKEEANTILEKYQKAFKPTKGFDLNKQLESAKKTLFVPSTLTGSLANHRKNLAVSISRAIAKGTQVEDESIDSIQASIKLTEARIKDFSDTLEARCRAEYAKWLDSQGDGKHLNDADRTVELLNIIDRQKEALQNEFSIPFLASSDDVGQTYEYRTAVLEQKSIKDASDAARRKREALSKDIADTNTRRIEAAADAESAKALEAQQQETAKSLPQYAQTSISFRGARELPATFSRPYIAVPANDQLAGKTVSFKIKGHTYNFECVANDSVESPTFSVAGQAAIGMLGSRDVYQLAYDTEGNAALVSSMPDKSDFDMYKALMGNEARRDSAGRIAVYYPTKEDGGGEYEVAGINQASHPVKSAQLKRMVEDPTVSNEEIENEVAAYYKQYTQQGVALVSSSTRSKGIELFMRDCTLNHGLEGAKKVVRRALGLGKNEDIYPAVSDFIRTYGEQQFLEALVRGRAEYYAAIIEANPKKQKFAQCWANRLKNISRASHALLRQRSN